MKIPINKWCKCINSNKCVQKCILKYDVKSKFKEKVA